MSITIKQKPEKATIEAKGPKPSKVGLDPSKVVLPDSEELPISAGASKATGTPPVTPKVKKKFTKLMNPLGKGSKGAKGADSFSEGSMDAILGDSGLLPTDPDSMYLPPEDRSGHRLRATSDGAEFRRKQVHRLLLRGVPRITIANHLGVNVETIHMDARIITQEMRQEMQGMDYTLYIGQSVAFYDECRNMALRLASDTEEKSNSVKMSALRAAIDAERAKHEFFHRVGLFKVVAATDPFHAINTGRQGTFSDENDLESFMSMVVTAAKGHVPLQLPGSTTQGSAAPRAE